MSLISNLAVKGNDSSRQLVKLALILLHQPKMCPDHGIFVDSTVSPGKNTTDLAAQHTSSGINKETQSAFSLPCLFYLSTAASNPSNPTGHFKQMGKEELVDPLSSSLRKRRRRSAPCLFPPPHTLHHLPHPVQMQILMCAIFPIS